MRIGRYAQSEWRTPPTRNVAISWRLFAVKNGRINPLAFPQTGLHFFASHAPEGVPAGRQNGVGDGDKELAGKAKPRVMARE